MEETQGSRSRVMRRGGQGGELGLSGAVRPEWGRLPAGSPQGRRSAWRSPPPQDHPETLLDLSSSGDRKGEEKKNAKKGVYR